MTKSRDKLKVYKNKKTTINGIIKDKQQIKWRGNWRTIITLKSVKIGEEFITDHIHFLLSPKRAEIFQLGDKIYVQAIINRYNTTKKIDNFLVKFHNYGVKKVIKIYKKTDNSSVSNPNK